MVVTYAFVRNTALHFAAATGDSESAIRERNQGVNGIVEGESGDGLHGVEWRGTRTGDRDDGRGGSIAQQKRLR